MEPPLCTNGSAGYLMQLSVRIITVLSENCVCRNSVNKVHIKQNKYKILFVVNLFCLLLCIVLQINVEWHPKP